MKCNVHASCYIILKTQSDRHCESGSKCSWEPILLSVKIPGNESSQAISLWEAKVPGSEKAREQKGQGAEVPGSELARVLLADSLRGANWPGSKKTLNYTN